MHVEPSELELAERIARKVAAKWSAVEVEDLTSQLYLWLLERESTLQRYRKEPGGEGKLYVSLYRAATKYCVAEQEQANGAPLDADSYKIEVIVNALPYIFDQGNWAQTTVAVHPHSGSALSRSNDSNTLVEVLTDIKRCFSKLSKDQQDILAMRYRDDLHLSEIADILGITKMTARNRIARAVKSLQIKLNGVA